MIKNGVCFPSITVTAKALIKMSHIKVRGLARLNLYFLHEEIHVPCHMKKIICV